PHGAHGGTPHGCRARPRRPGRRHAPRQPARVRHPGGRHGRPDGAERLPRGAGVSAATPPPASTVGPVLRVAGLAGSIGTQPVIESIDLEVPAGQVTAILGRNGAGKTSTIKAILGLITRTGVVELDGE